jgi:hypothetical protein
VEGVERGIAEEKIEMPVWCQRRALDGGFNKSACQSSHETKGTMHLVDFGAPGDRLAFSAGMIRWYFVHGSGVYQVNSQQYWEELPRPEILSILYRHDKRRFFLWLEAREKARQVAWEARTKEQRQALIFDHGPVILPRRRRSQKREAKEKAFQRKLKLKPRRWLVLKPDGSKCYSVFVSDHDYIEAMFRLYAQQRCRLLA